MKGFQLRRECKTIMAFAPLLRSCGRPLNLVVRRPEDVRAHTSLRLAPLVGRSVRKGTFTILCLVCAEGVPSGDAAEYDEPGQVEALCQVLRRAVHRIPSLGADDVPSDSALVVAGDSAAQVPAEAVSFRPGLRAEDV